MAVDPEQLRRHLDDYARCTGRSVERFICPITERECDESELIDGHILNKKIISASRQTVIQYGKVDGFYGTRVEPALIDFLNMPKKTPADMMRAAGSLTLTLADGSELEAFVPGPAAALSAAEKFPCVDLRKDGKVEVSGLFVRTDKDDPRIRSGSLEATWEVRFMPSHWVAAMLKTAYLALFHLLGYRAILDTFGEFIRQTLHAYFRDEAKREAASGYFYPFRNALKMMLRPDTGTPLAGFADTLRDSMFLLHFTPAGLMFAATLFFEVNDVTATVTLPMSNVTDDPLACDEAMRVYNSLMEDETSVEQRVQWAQMREGKWHLHPDKRSVRYR